MKGLRPPHHFVKMICSSATEVREEESTATDWTCSTGTLLTSRIERTARFEAMATPGKISRSEIVA